LQHPQLAVEPRQQIVTFEGCTQADTPAACANISGDAGIFTAQIFDNTGQFLFGEGANGGPISLSQQVAKFFLGVNDPLGQNWTGAPSSPEIFDLYGNWSNLYGHGPEGGNVVR
jgi:hypothetical protein